MKLSMRVYVVVFSMLESSFTRIHDQKIARFVLKIFKILNLYGFEIKRLYFDNNFEIQQLKMILTVRKTTQHIQLS